MDRQSGPRYAPGALPDGFRGKDPSFDLFLRTLRAKGVGPERVAGIEVTPDLIC
jgi:hypothetical protein